MKARKVLGLTLAELLVVVAVVMVLAAVLSPMIKESKRSAQASASVQHLRQMHLAIDLYMGPDAPDVAPYDRPSEEHFYYGLFAKSPQLLKSPCGDPMLWTGQKYVQSITGYGIKGVGPADPSYWAYFELHRENSILITDQSCNDFGVWDFPSTTKLGLGVRRSGQLLRVKKTGMPSDFRWWH